MSKIKNTLLPILLAAVFIAASEFFRNSLLLQSHWINHYRSLGLVFPEAPLNGAVWGVWSLLFSTGIYLLSKKFSLWQTAFLSWFFGFVLMWIVIGNMGVLPFAILFWALPLSLLEVFVAALIIGKFSQKNG